MKRRNPSIRRLRALARQSVSLFSALYVDSTWRRHRDAAATHPLPLPVSISLTSYPPRYPTLHLTLKSLLAQSVRADEIILWIADSEISSLPAAVNALDGNGVSIRICENLNSYKKIIPALISCQPRYLVIADDDLYYHRLWLQEMINAYKPDNKLVVCGRAHRIRTDRNGHPEPYANWETEIAENKPERFVFPTGVGGVFYEPGIFHRDVTRSDLFMELCPNADDVWLYWMAALNGALFQKVGRRRRQILWGNTQNVALMNVNVKSNDLYIRRMVDRYGFPVG